MTSALQQAVSDILLGNYASLVILTAVGYDYVLTFTNEIEYIWNKPWTRVSTLFFIARYFGLCSLIFLTISGILINCGAFSFWIMIAATDLMMILRVWVLYDRSRVILSVLLPLYVGEVVTALIGCILLRSQNSTEYDVSQAQYILLCEPKPFSLTFSEVVDTLQLSLGGLMCLLLALRFVQESLEMYNATKHLQFSHYMCLLTREGMFYFLAIVSYAVINLANYIGDVPMDGWWIALRVAEYLPVYTLVPRLILSLRELYSRDLQGRRGSDIDTAFGFTSIPCHVGVSSRIVFADGATQNEPPERGEEMGMEEWQNRGTDA